MHCVNCDMTGMLKITLLVIIRYDKMLNRLRLLCFCPR